MNLFETVHPPICHSHTLTPPSLFSADVSVTSLALLHLYYKAPTHIEATLAGMADVLMTSVRLFNSLSLQRYTLPLHRNPGITAKRLQSIHNNVT